MISSFRRILPLCCGLAMILAASSHVASEEDAENFTLVRVNGEAITLEDLDAELSGFRLARSRKPDVAMPQAELVLRRLIQNRLLEQEGYRLGAQDQPLVRNQVQDFLRLKAVVALMDSVSSEVARITATQLDSLLDRKSTMRHYAHILVAEESLARSLYDSLAAGADFAGLARRHSVDGNASVGGDLGWAAAGSYVGPFETAARLLAPGQTSSPVETEFGWHLIRLVEEREETFGQSVEMREAMHAAAEREERMKAVRRYVRGLRERDGVSINDSLLATLDYGADDAEIQTRLRESEEALAFLPTGRLTVRGLSREILFKYFHGLAGREDADRKRDEVFSKWVDEALLSHESKVLGLRDSPELRRRAERVERGLVREEVLKTLLARDQEQSEEALRAYHSEHADRFTRPGRLRLRSVLVADEEAAAAIRVQLEQGVQLKWLAERDPRILAGAGPLGEDWLSPSSLDPALGADMAQAGELLGPVSGEGGWILAEVIAREDPVVQAFADCRAEVASALKRDRNREILASAFDRLEAAAAIEIAAEATDRIEQRLNEIAAEADESSLGAADQSVNEGGS